MKLARRAFNLLALASLVPVIATAATLEVSGSTTVQKQLFEPAAAALQSAAGIETKFLPVGSGKGLIALVEGKVSVSASSEALNETVESAKKAAKELDKAFVAPANLVFHEIMRDTMLVIVHKDNPVTSLTKAQLKDLNTGKIKNWKEVGGPDMPVKVVTSHAGSATRAVFQKQVMDGAEYAPGAAEIRTTKEEINEVGKDKGGIGALSEAFIAANPGKVKVIKGTEISRPLGFITAGQPTPEVQKMINYFRSPEGRKLTQ